MSKISQAAADKMSDGELSAISALAILASPSKVLQRWGKLNDAKVTTLETNQKKITSKGPETVDVGTFQPTKKGPNGGKVNSGEAKPVLEFKGGDQRPFGLGPAKIERIIREHDAGNLRPLLDRLNKGDA